MRISRIRVELSRPAVAKMLANVLELEDVPEQEDVLELMELYRSTLHRRLSNYFFPGSKIKVVFTNKPKTHVYADHFSYYPAPTQLAETVVNGLMAQMAAEMYNIKRTVEEEGDDTAGCQSVEG